MLLCAVTVAASVMVSRDGSAQAAVRQGKAIVAAADQPVLEKALAAYDAGQVQQARPVLATLAARYPGNVMVQTAAGMSYLESGDLGAGAGYLQRAHLLAPQNAAVTENLGIALLHLHRAAEALPLLQQACHLEPANITARLGEAQALMELKRYDDAAASFEFAVQHAGAAGSTGDLRHDWALALFDANRPQQAAAVLQGTPDAEANAPTQELLGEVEEKLGHFQPAFTHFKRAAELDPSEANLLAYGNELLQHWTFPAAIEVLRYAHTRYPASERVATGLGVAYFGNNDFAHAAEIFHAQLAAQPGSAIAADMLGRSCSAQVSGAVDGCGDLVVYAESHPHNAFANLYAATALLHNAANPADAAKAETLLKQALSTSSRLAEAWYQLAVVQQQRNQWPESAASLEHAVALRPGYAEAHYRLARAYSHTGRKDEAQQQMALQQQSAQTAKDADNRRMQEVMTFVTVAN